MLERVAAAHERRPDAHVLGTEHVAHQRERPIGSRLPRLAARIDAEPGDPGHGLHEHLEEAALAAALRSGPIAGAALDVLAQEPMHPGHPLLGLPNCILTPHLAWASEPAPVAFMAACMNSM